MAVQRSRLTLAAYNKMGIHDLVATNVSDYVRIGRWLVNDNDARITLQKAIAAASSVLFEDPNVLKAWEEALWTAVTLRGEVLARAFAEYDAAVTSARTIVYATE